MKMGMWSGFKPARNSPDQVVARVSRHEDFFCILRLASFEIQHGGTKSNSSYDNGLMG